MQMCVFYSIFCVMLTGSALTDGARNSLLRAACEMFQKGRNEKKIKTESVEGKVKTDGRYSGLGSVYGMMFYADIESENGRSKIDFIVRTQDLVFVEDLDKAIEEGFWLERNQEREQAARWN